jgi:hypothetical protein
MRFFSVILSFYFIALSSMFCGESSHAMEFECTAESSHEQNNSSHQEDSEELCSPFCVCSCCNITVLQVAFVNAVSKDFVPRYNVSNTVISGLEQEVHVKIFDPPRV